MLYRVFYLLSLSLLIGCVNNEIYYKWDIVKYECKNINETEQELIFKVKYKIKNNTNENVWFYDMQRGNDWQYIEFEKEENILKRNLFIYKPFEKSNGGWYGSGGYNQNDPDSFLICPSKKKEGVININFIIENISDVKDIVYQFNFIILEIDINKYFSELSIYDINEIYSKNYYIEVFMSKWKTWECRSVMDRDTQR